MSRPSATVYYSRRTLVWWCFGLTVLWACIFGLFYVNTAQERMEEAARLRAQARGREEELIRLRAANRSLQERSAELLAQTEKLLAEVKKLAPPEIAVEERLLPPGKAEEIVPGRLFLTLVRFEGPRARLRLAAVGGGLEGQGSRLLTPGEPWEFAFAGERYTLLVHELSARPPGARISIRKNPSEKR